jgi:hypothetical protein
MIHTVQPGDLLTMVGPDLATSDPFVLAEIPFITRDSVWLYREFDAPIVVDRTYGLDSTFILHDRDNRYGGKHRVNG